MNPIIKNILAVLAGILIGSAVNMSIVKFGGILIASPEGVDPNNLESIKANIHMYEFKHFLMPFLAHALGTLAGAFIATLIAANHQMKFALGIGAYFLLGGIAMSFLIPAPAWFIATDILLAYIPMAWLGCRLAERMNAKS